MKVALVFDNNHPCTTGWYVYKELKLAGHEPTIFKPTEIKNIPSHKPDLILAVDSGTHYIADVNVHPKLLWLIDTHVSYVCDETMAKSFDIIFVAQKNDLEKLKKKFKFVYWLPLAADPEFHGHMSLAKEFDLAMVSGYGHGKRRIMMDRLKNAYPNSLIGPAECRRIGDIYSRSKIVFNHSIKNDINMRVFEGLCSGSLVITSEIKNNGFEDLFEDGKDLVTYSNFNDLRNKIDYYLNHEEERTRIGETGRVRVLKEHTYKARIDFMLSEVNKLGPSIVRSGQRKNKFYFNKLKLELRFKEVLWTIIKAERRIIWKIQELVS